MLVILPSMVWTSVAQPTEQYGHRLGTVLAFLIRRSAAWASVGARFAPRPERPARAVPVALEAAILKNPRRERSIHIAPLRCDAHPCASAKTLAPTTPVRKKRLQARERSDATCQRPVERGAGARRAPTVGGASGTSGAAVLSLEIAEHVRPVESRRRQLADDERHVLLRQVLGAMAGQRDLDPVPLVLAVARLPAGQFLEPVIEQPRLHLAPCDLGRHGLSLGLRGSVCRDAIPHRHTPGAP